MTPRLRRSRSTSPAAEPPCGAGARLWRDTSGQTLVLTALCMVVLMGFLGLAIDVGQLRFEKRRLQNAADAAALAGALELQACGGSPNCGSMQAAAQSALAENGFASSALLTQCATASGTGVEMTLNNAPCEQSSDPHGGNAAYVEVLVSEPRATTFARVLGINSVLLRARAEAALAGKGNCVYALDRASSAAVEVTSGATVTSSCGVMVASTSSSALTCDSSASLSAPRITVAGGTSSSGCFPAAQPITGASMPGALDPLASLATPAVPACGTSSATPFHGASAALTITGTAVLYPDAAYCGGITLAAGANVTFQPGTYVLTGPASNTQSHGTAVTTTGGLSVDVGATASGNGVTFYNVSPSGGVTFQYSGSNGNVNLSAPTSGTYAGILFFQDASVSTGATILGTAGTGTVLQGTFYFPAATVQMGYDGASDYNILVANDIQFVRFQHGGGSTGTNLGSQYASLPNGYPLPNAGAVIVE